MPPRACVSRTVRTLCAALLGLCVLAGLNVLAARLDWRCDLTEGKRYSLAPATRTMLAQMNATVAAAAFFRPQEPGRAVIRDLFEMFARENPAFSFEFVDPDRSPFRARELGVTRSGAVVVLCGDRTETLELPNEEALANAVIRVTTSGVSTVWFTTGHGELSADGPAPDLSGQPAAQAKPGDPTRCAVFKNALTARGMRVGTVTLARLTSVLDSVGALVIAGPTRDFLPSELVLINAFAARGGRLFVALDAERPTNLEEWMRTALHVERRPGLVLDPTSDAMVGDPLSPLVQEYGTHPAVRDFSLMTLFPTATALAPAREPGGVRPVRPDAPGMSMPAVTALARTSEQVWLERDLTALRKGKAAFDSTRDLPGPLWIGVACDPGPAGAPRGEPDTRPATRAVVFGDQDFMADAFVGVAGNLDLARNCVHWLMDKEGLLTVSRPRGANVFLLLSPWQRRMLVWTPLAVVPGGALCLAVWVALRRRAGC